MENLVKFFVVFVFIVPIIFVGSYAQESQHFLKVRSTPNILYIQGTGFYDAGTVVRIPEVPSSWQEYEFVGWKIDGVWALGDTVEIRMDGAHVVDAIFEKKTSGNVVIDTIPRIAEITVDGEIYLIGELPLTFEWDVHSEHIISIPDVVKEGTSERYKFWSWKDKNGQTFRRVSIDDSKATEFIALYKKQFYLKSISEKGIILGDGWHEESSTVPIKVESEIVDDKIDEKIRYVFNSWNLGDYQTSPENTVDIVQSATIEANWDTEFKLDIITNVPDYDLFGGWYISGKQVPLIAEQIIDSDDSEARYAFERWISKGPNPAIIQNGHSNYASITLDAPYLIEAHYEKSHKVNAWTPYGDAQGSGFYKEGDFAEIKIAENEIMVNPNKEKKIFDGWNAYGASTVDFSKSIDGQTPNTYENLMIQVDKPVNVTANWKTQYNLNIISSEGEVKGAGWYDTGRIVPISVNEKSLPKDFWTSLKFKGWSGDFEDSSPRATIKMDGPKVIIAEWEEDTSTGIFNIMILAGAGITGAMVFMKTRKNKFLAMFKKQHNPIAYEQNPFEKYEEKALDYKYQVPPQKTKKKKVFDWLMGKAN